MNDLKATVILIRWKKHSNQMEAGPVRLGRVGRDPRFSLALSANSGGSWLGGSRGSALRKAQYLGLGRSWRLSGYAPGRAARRASRREPGPVQCAQGGSSSGNGTGIPDTPGTLAPSQRSAAGDSGEGAAGGAQIARTPAEAGSHAAGEGLSPRKS